MNTQTLSPVLLPGYLTDTLAPVTTRTGSHRIGRTHDERDAEDAVIPKSSIAIVTLLDGEFVRRSDAHEDYISFMVSAEFADKTVVARVSANRDAAKPWSVPVFRLLAWGPELDGRVFEPVWCHMIQHLADMAWLYSADTN